METLHILTATRVQQELPKQFKTSKTEVVQQSYFEEVKKVDDLENGFRV
jgi:hypothetical protein